MTARAVIQDISPFPTQHICYDHTQSYAKAELRKSAQPFNSITLGIENIAMNNIKNLIVKVGDTYFKLHVNQRLPPYRGDCEHAYRCRYPPTKED